MKKLYKSRTDFKLAGVCGGIAQYFGADPTVVRLITAAAILFGGMGFFAYIVAAIIIPPEPAGHMGEFNHEEQPEDYRNN